MSDSDVSFLKTKSAKIFSRSRQIVHNCTTIIKLCNNALYIGSGEWRNILLCWKAECLEWQSNWTRRNYLSRLYSLQKITMTVSAMASQITGLTIVYSAVYSDQRNHQSSASPVAHFTNFNPSMDKYITNPVKCGMKILIHSWTSTVAPLKFRNG